MQAQNLLVAAMVGGLAWILAGRRWTAWVFLSLFTIVSGYQLLDQIFYKIFFSHIHKSMVGGGAAGFNLTITLSSFTQELDRLFWFNAAIVILTCAALAWCIRRTPQLSPRRLDVLGVLLIAGLPAIASDRYFHLNEHPLVAMASEATSRGLEDVLRSAPASTTAHLFNAQPDRDPALADWARSMRARTRPPNVILIELESVGSVQLLDPSGKPREWATPNLSRLAQHSIIFPNVYTVFPGTTRTIVFLHTGGRTISWGGEFEFGYPYTGPMLAPTFSTQGYRTALFSAIRLDGEGSDVFLQKAGFDKMYDFAQDYAHHKPEFMVTSWGAREELVAQLAESWIADTSADASKDKRPFFLKFMTTATHHPYGVPPGYLGPLRGDDRKTHYLNALHYTDSVIGQLMTFLDAHGLRDDTIIAVIGDHGQAFGEQHAWNFTHKNELYEENIRSFLMLATPTLPGTRVSRRLGWISDVMPTLTALAGAQPPDVPGQSLVQESFPARTIFFHKNSTPEKWGLRDGRWKFVQEIRTGANAELYDLETDPEEKVNVIAQHKDVIPAYREQLTRWFLNLNGDFTAHLKGYPQTAKQGLAAKDVIESGPKVMTVGLRQPPRGVFLETSTFQEHQAPVVWVRWVGDTANRRLRMLWDAPDGKHYAQDQAAEPDWIDLFFRIPKEAPQRGKMVPGEWKVRLFWNDKEALSTTFRVDRTEQ